MYIQVHKLRQVMLQKFLWVLSVITETGNTVQLGSIC